MSEMPLSKRDQVLSKLRTYESRNVTYVDPHGDWPIVWHRAKGNYVWDIEGKRYLDLTAAFGVAACGHGNRRVLRAACKQFGQLAHGMGDVHPHALKAELAEALSELTFGRWWKQGARRAKRGKVVFGNSGFESIEAALKTAFLATGRHRVVAFKGGYHGLGYGALNATHRDLFRGPFRRQLGEFADFEDFPTVDSDVERVLSGVEERLRSGRIGAVLIEPIQGRGGFRVAAEGFLSGLRALCDAHGALLIFDEIYCGFCRSGKWFACEYEKVVPDLICLGKALTGGFPLSACVGDVEIMDEAWPESEGEAIHTSTYLGHPVGCAMALAQIQELKQLRMNQAVTKKSRYLMKALSAWSQAITGGKVTVVGRGLMCGVDFEGAVRDDFPDLGVQLMKAMLRRGVLILPEGESALVMGWCPPLTITEKQLEFSIGVMGRCFQHFQRGILNAA